MVDGVHGGLVKEFFPKFAKRVATVIGSPYAFALALLLIIGWGVLGPVFKFSDTWQLAINTTTTIVTFLVVFMIQNTQNRDSKAIHLKLDELIRSIRGARNGLIDSEDLDDAEIARLEQEFAKLRGRARKLNARTPKFHGNALTVEKAHAPDHATVGEHPTPAHAAVETPPATGPDEPGRTAERAASHGER